MLLPINMKLIHHHIMNPRRRPIRLPILANPDMHIPLPPPPPRAPVPKVPTQDPMQQRALLRRPLLLVLRGAAAVVVRAARLLVHAALLVLLDVEAGRKLALLAQAAPEEDETDWHGHAQGRHAAEERAGPVDADAVEHVGREAKGC